MIRRTPAPRSVSLIFQQRPAPPEWISRELGGCQRCFFRPDGVMEVLPCPILLQVEPLAEHIVPLP